MTVATSTGSSSTAGYYGQPIVAPHVWEDTIGWYFFTGGLAGASAVLASAADIAGKQRLATHARRAAMIGLVPSPLLLIADLGRPERFANMLRVVKPTSPMNIGSWLLAVFAPAAGGAWILGELGRLPTSTRMLGLVGAVTGAVVTTYTAVLVTNTATPAWHEAKGELPYVFAASAAGSAGATVTVLSAMSGRPDPIAVAVGAGGAVAEAIASTVMQRRLGDLSTYHSDAPTRRLDRLAKLLSIGGAVGLVAARQSRLRTSIAAAAVLTGSVCVRLAVLRAGTASASDPASVLRQQQRP